MGRSGASTQSSPLAESDFLKVSLSTDPVASRERFATCRQPHGNREGLTFLSVSPRPSPIHPRREGGPSRSARKKRKPPIILASLGCFFAHLSYSLRTARLASSFFMLAMQTSSRITEDPTRLFSAWQRGERGGSFKPLRVKLAVAWGAA
jgi:hypothetical protein